MGSTAPVSSAEVLRAETHALTAKPVKARRAMVSLEKRSRTLAFSSAPPMAPSPKQPSRMP